MRHFLGFIALFWLFIFPIGYLKAEKLNVVNFKLISTENGLSQKSVRKVFQDSSGFIWLGTQEGLNRYDGRVFEHFKHDELDEGSLSSDVIRDIIEDSNKNIWVATGNGLNLFIPASKTFKRIDIFNEDNQAVSRLNTLFENGDGKLFVGTDGYGIFQIFKTDSGYTIKRSELFPTVTGFDIRVIFEDSRNRYWVGSDGNGVWLKDAGPLRLLSTDPAHNRIMAISEDSKGQVWVGTLGEGLNKFNERTLSFQNFQFNSADDSSLSNNRIYKILEHSSGTLWVATDKGINLYNPELENFTRIINFPSQQFSLIHNRVLDIFEDKNGLVWIGTLAGLNLWNPVDAKFVQYQHISESKKSLSNNTVSSFTENHQGDIYVATFGGGINRIDALTHQISTANQHFDIHDDRLSALLIDRNNNLWVGSATKGVRVFNSKNETLNSFDHIKNDQSSLSSNAITNIFEDSDGEIWISTYGAGLNRYQKKSNTFKRYNHNPNNSNSLSSNDVYQIFEGDEGYIWLATAGGGLSRLDKHSNSFMNFKTIKNQPNSLPTNTAWSITQDTKGRFWIGTQGMGLARWEPEDRRQGKQNFKNYSIQSGLPSSTVNGVVEDDQGYIWISTNKGVSRLNPEDDTFTHFNLADSIHHNEFIQGAILKASNGRVYIGGLNGISAFFPHEITINENVPKVVLTQIMSTNKPLVFEKPINQLENISFDHNDYFITFEFAALDYAQPQLNQYQYKLEGFDEDWIKINNLNRANYTNLPSGSYIFKVKGSNNDGVWSDEAINLKVIIKPAPWVSWWAFVIYSFIFSLLLLVFIRSQAKRIANNELFKKQVSEELSSQTRQLEIENKKLTKQIGDQLNNSGVDLESGLYNPSFFTEQLMACLKWYKNYKSTEQRLLCIMGHLKSNDLDINKSYFKQIAESFGSRDEILLISRWSENEFALLCLIESVETIDEILEFLSPPSLIGNDFKMPELAIGFTLNPIHYNDSEALKWNNILMLTEHSMRSAIERVGSKHIGILSCHKKLDQKQIKKIMTSDNILDHKDIFKFKIK